MANRVLGPYPSKADIKAQRLRHKVREIADRGGNSLLTEEQTLLALGLTAAELGDDLVLLAEAGHLYEGELYFDSSAVATRLEAQQQNRAAGAGQEDAEQTRWRAEGLLEEFKAAGIDTSLLDGGAA